MRIPRLLAPLAAAGAFVLIAVSVLAPASADPVPGGPSGTDLVMVSAPTLYPFDEGLATAFAAGGPASKLYVYEACKVPNPPKPGCPQISLPCDPISALNNNTNTCVDIAGSSRGPHTGNTDWFIPFAQDAVGWSAYTGGNAPYDLTSADLTAIYSCTITNWNQITDEPGYTGPNATIDVFVPSSGSGTRAFFLGALGITAPTEPCWQAATPAEDEGTDAAFGSDINAIFPYSLSHYVGQVYDGKGSGSDQPGVLDALRSIDGNAQIDQTNKVWNTNFPLAYTHNVNHVVRQADWADPTEGPRLKALLDSSTNGGYLCRSAASLIISYGFQTLGTHCGVRVAGT